MTESVENQWFSCQKIPVFTGNSVFTKDYNINDNKEKKYPWLFMLWLQQV